MYQPVFQKKQKCQNCPIGPTFPLLFQVNRIKKQAEVCHAVPSPQGGFGGLSPSEAKQSSKPHPIEI